LTIESKAIFDMLVHQSQMFLTAEDVNTLKDSDKESAIATLHWTFGGKIRNTLGLWGVGADEKLRAIEEYSNQGPLLGYDGDGASSALVGYMWDQLHTAIAT
jgi:hypothetical protein